MPEPAALHRSVFITGTSTGIGRACVARLDQAGWRVFAGVRREEDVAALRREFCDRVTGLIIDIADEQSIVGAANVVCDGLGDPAALHGLVNNAGGGVGGPLEFLDMAELREQFEVNVFGHIALTQKLLPALRRGGGRIVNMSSISGRFALPFLGPYSASKFAFAALSDAWRREIADQGVGVSIIEPGCVESAIWDKGIERVAAMPRMLPPEALELYGRYFDTATDAITEAQKSCIPADRVARVVEKALTARRPKTRYLVGPDARIGARLVWLLPDRMLDFLVARGRRKRARRVGAR